jgi:TRAP-type C4-dicarboxylate transport system permease small subunit
MQRAFGVLARAVSAFASLLGATSAIVIALIGVVVAYNVVQRVTFGHTIHGIVDVSALALAVIAFGGCAQAEISEAHVRMSLLSDRVGPKMRKTILVTAQFVMGALAVVMIQATYERAVASYLVNEVQSAQKFLPIWPIRFFIVIGLAGFLAVCIMKLVRALRSDGSPVGTETEAGHV